jgi:ribonuclease-3
VKQITGRKPSNLEVYKLAFSHTSIAKENVDGFKESNERLEYLGDAVLGMVIAEYLFKRFPYKDEGFLTEIRSRIVSRESLGQLGRKIGLDKLVVYDTKRKTALSFKYLHGDTMEAFIGAIFLDKGFKFCRHFIAHNILNAHIDLKQLIDNDTNYKSKIIEWAQRHNKIVKFQMVDEKGHSHQKQFKIQIVIGEEVISFGLGFSKKNAEQDAARKACEILNI